MKTVVKALILLGFVATVSGCVVAPVGRPARVYVGVPAPVVVVHPYYERRW
jgi:hypothetical protein